MRNQLDVAMVCSVFAASRHDRALAGYRLVGAFLGGANWSWGRLKAEIPGYEVAF